MLGLAATKKQIDKTEEKDSSHLPFSSAVLVRLLIEVEQRGCGGENWQDRVDWIVKTAAKRAEENKPGEK